MIDAEKLSPEELRKLAEEKESAENKPIKEGFLKDDLYWVHTDRCDRVMLPDYVVGNKEKELLVQKCAPSFEKVLDKGSRFLCYIDSHRGGGESWWDEKGEHVEDYLRVWAEENLENIRELL